MPLKYVDGKKFTQRWDREWDIILLIVAHNYRSPKGIIKWKKARADGYFESFPQYLTNKDFSRRLAYLMNCKYNAKWKAKKNEKQRQAVNRVSGNPRSYNRRHEIFKSLPQNVKEKYGYKTKRIWSSEQQDLLIGMAEEYRVSEKKIDWRSFIKDERVKHLPHDNLKKLRSYYWRILTLATDPDALEKKRASSRQWKAEHIDRYNKNQSRQRKIIRKATNDYINAQQK
jgi:hypothetical protein